MSSGPASFSQKHERNQQFHYETLCGSRDVLMLNSRICILHVVDRHRNEYKHNERLKIRNLYRDICEIIGLKNRIKVKILN